MKKRSLLAAIMLLLAILPAAPTGATEPTLPPLISPQAFGQFADRIIADQMAQVGIPGAVVLLIKDGELFFAKGYGYADVERQIPWDPARTVLRAKSLSKLVTATAVMQLYERGELDLHAPISTYPLTFPHQVTAANLLTHTGGFADRGVATNVRDAADLMPLQSYLARNRYPMVYTPGERISYGDHGPTMLAHTVERISGQPFPQYTASQIFAPLGMERSSFAQPYPEELQRDLAMGYISVLGRYVPQPAGYSQVYPAGGLLTTAEDMGRFMLAHLQEGGPILQPATVREMHRQQFTQHPALPGLAYGFWEEYPRGQRALWHAGEGLGFATWLYLLPEQQVGLFIATNRRDFTLHRTLTDQLLPHLLPWRQLNPPKPMDGYQERAARFAGVYQFFRHDRRKVEKMNDEEAVIRAHRDGTLSTSFAPGRWIEVEPLLFRQIDGDGVMAFRDEGRGRITHLYTDHWPWAFEKGRWYDARAFRFSLLGGSLLVMLSGLLLWRRQPAPTGARAARITAALVASLSLLTVAVLLPTLVVNIQGGDIATLYGMPPLLVGNLVLALFTAALTATLPVFTLLAWWHRWWRLPQRLHYSLVTLAACAFVWFLHYLNLVGFRY